MTTEPLPRVQALDAFLSAAPELVADQLRGLHHDLAGDANLAERAVPAIIAALPQAEDDRAAMLAVLLGLLAESGADAVRDSVHRGLYDYLGLLAERGPGSPALLLGLTYLVAHFREDANIIRDCAAGAPLPDTDRARLDRCLSPLDPENPELTRVWPDPTGWRALPAADKEFDRQWMVRVPLPHRQLAYDLDTRSLLAYAGAKALWTAEHGPGATGPDPDLRLSPRPAAAAPVDTRLAVLRCPTCAAPLAGDGDSVACTAEGTTFPVHDGTVDLSLGAGDAHEPMTRNVPLCYSEIRPAFLRWKGSNWDGAVSVEDEDEYLRTHVRPVDGPVLDLAAGTGRWTAVLADTFGADRVLALDLSAAMLRLVRAGLPGVMAVRGNALSLPINDASLGAVNCWNALQSLPDPAAAIADVGRCLRPGGTFTLMTFRPSTDPLYRTLQTAPFGVVPVALSTTDDLVAWLSAAGMTVAELATPGSFVFITATRDAP